MISVLVLYFYSSLSKEELKHVSDTCMRKGAYHEDENTMCTEWLQTLVVVKEIDSLRRNASKKSNRHLARRKKYENCFFLI